MTHPLTPREKVRKAIIDVMKPKDADITLGRVDTCTDAILTALASGSGDHAELARLAEAAKAAGDPFYSFGDVAEWGEFQKVANPDAVLALLAEIAALRDERDALIAVDEAGEPLRQAQRDRATEAERKLAEAVGLLETLSLMFHPDSAHGRHVRTFLECSR